VAFDYRPFGTNCRFYLEMKRNLDFEVGTESLSGRALEH